MDNGNVSFTYILRQSLRIFAALETLPFDTIVSSQIFKIIHVFNMLE